jgi:hypothetical protein
MSNNMEMPAISSRSKLGPLSALGLSTPATMLNSLKRYVGSLTHEAKREPLNFRDLVRLARCRDVTTAWRHSDDISKRPHDRLTVYGLRGVFVELTRIGNINGRTARIH